MIKENIVVNKPTALYRHFTKHNTLLYIGISLSAIYRLSQHARQSHWYRMIDYIRIVHYPSRESALKAEYKAIKKEKPKFNIVHKYREPPPITNQLNFKAPRAAIFKGITPRLLRMKHLVLYCNISKSHIWNLISKDKFPKGHKFSSNITVWDINEINNWLDEYEI